MPEWLIQNLGTIIVCAVIVAGCALLVWSLIRDKKKGKSLCGGNCGSCSMGCHCHSAKAPSPDEKNVAENGHTEASAAPETEADPT